MQFSLIDRILELEEGSHIKAVKTLSMAEEYLKDHFPRFPCMPGVLMVESMFQAAAWLIRKSENFTNSMVVLKEIRNLCCYACSQQPRWPALPCASLVKMFQQPASRESLVDTKPNHLQHI